MSAAALRPALHILLAAAAAAAPAAPGGQQAHPLLLLDDFESLHRAAWRVEQGADVEVLLEPTYPWEQDVHSEGTVLVDPFDGLYKAFYVSAPASYPAKSAAWCTATRCPTRRQSPELAASGLRSPSAKKTRAAFPLPRGGRTARSAHSPKYYSRSARFPLALTTRSRTNYGVSHGNATFTPVEERRWQKPLMVFASPALRGCPKPVVRRFRLMIDLVI